MGGKGSGRIAGGGRATTWGLRSLHTGELQRSGWLRSGRTCERSWKRKGETIASIVLQGGFDWLDITYNAREANIWRTVKDRIEIQWVACPFGGDRPYFICPGLPSDCGRRVLHLYEVQFRFRCRHCHKLTFDSRRETKARRARCATVRIPIKLVRVSGKFVASTRRPKGMWRRTYKRLSDRLLAAIKADLAVDERLALQRVIDRYYRVPCAGHSQDAE